MPVVHWSASVFSTEAVFTCQGPSSKVSTTSLSFRKSSCLQCSKPNPGPPVVSIWTTRETPSASGAPLQATLGPGGGAGGAGGAGAAAGAFLAAAPGAGGAGGAFLAAAAGAGAAPLAGACADAAPASANEIAPAKIKPAALRIAIPFRNCPRARPDVSRGAPASILAEQDLRRHCGVFLP